MATDFGAVEGTVAVDYREHHCAARDRCCIVAEPLGRRILVSRKLLNSLVQTRNAFYRGGPGAELVHVRVDHVGSGAAREWVYRLFAVRWRDTYPAASVDPQLMLGVWPD